jgi:predicted transcriptional regulator
VFNTHSINSTLEKAQSSDGSSAQVKQALTTLRASIGLITDQDNVVVRVVALVQLQELCVDLHLRLL